MLKLASLAMLAVALVATTPAQAQGWGFDDEPGFFNDVRPFSDHPPEFLGPVERRDGTQSPDDVFDMLEDEGFSDFGPMAERGRTYKLTAVNPEGDLVALDISVLDGEILRERVLEARFQARPREAQPRLQSPPRIVPANPPEPAAAKRRAPEPVTPQAAPRKPSSSASAPPLSERLKKLPPKPTAETGGDDPMVVY